MEEEIMIDKDIKQILEIPFHNDSIKNSQNSIRWINGLEWLWKVEGIGWKMMLTSPSFILITEFSECGNIKSLSFHDQGILLLYNILRISRGM